MYIYIYIYTYAFFFLCALHCSANTSPIVLRLGAANKPPCWQSLAPGPPLLGSSRTSAHTQYNAVYTDHHSRIQAACGPHMADTMCSLIQNTGPAWYPSYGDSLKTDSSKAWSCRQTSMLAKVFPPRLQDLYPRCQRLGPERRCQRLAPGQCCQRLANDRSPQRQRTSAA